MEKQNEAGEWRRETGDEKPENGDRRMETVEWRGETGDGKRLKSVNLQSGLRSAASGLPFLQSGRTHCRGY